MKKFFKVLSFIIYLMFFICDFAVSAPKIRIKDIARIQGVRVNHLFGYGLVIGLDGTGDSSSTEFTVQSVAAMLEKLGVNVPKNLISVSNVAAVMVTAELPAFSKPGSRIDITISSLGDAKSLYGGVLLITPLQAVDGKIYAVAQGPVSLGGFSFGNGGTGGASAVKNIPTTGIIPNGALIEKAVPTTVVKNKMIYITLNNPDYTSSERLTEAINALFQDCATAKDAATVSVRIPQRYLIREATVDFISKIERLSIEPDISAKIVINERTGTIVAGDDVRISRVAVSHGNLNVVIKSNPVVSQPNPLGAGVTTVVSDQEVVVEEEANPLTVVDEGITIGEVASALNALGATPRDLIAIFQAMKRAGAIQAELIIM
ncbi:flagellar basal body P-ring protein FlgI [bacterium]|nr:flagellar basal body P-ring protein FlgI [bacterium]